MISSLTGQLRHVDEARIQLEAGAITYELWIPAADAGQLREMIGQSLTFHTVFYLEGDPSRGGLQPRLIGFMRPDDRRFFELFTTVKGIGPRTALRALTASVGEIAQAIEDKDARFLVRLDGIGKRTAELVIAELAGKAKRFILPGTPGTGGAPRLGRPGRPAVEEDAIAALMALDDRMRRPEAENLLERAKQGNPAIQTTDAFLREMLRLRTVRE
jgi:Holliday junction DNA helicase RuvA